MTRRSRYFVGLAVDQKAPDHSTLTVFRERLLQRGRLKVFEEMLAEIIQIVDSVHSVANVNTAKDKRRQGKGKGPHDPDAQWGVKRQRKVKTEAGKEIEQTEYFYGCKAHVSLNAESGLITSLEVTSGEAYAGHHFCELIDHDLEQKLALETVAADKGYDDSNNHFYLEQHGLHSAICLKDTRTGNRNEHKETWLKLVNSPI